MSVAERGQYNRCNRDKETRASPLSRVDPPPVAWCQSLASMMRDVQVSNTSTSMILEMPSSNRLSPLSLYSACLPSVQAKHDLSLAARRQLDFSQSLLRELSRDASETEEQANRHEPNDTLIDKQSRGAAEILLSVSRCTGLGSAMRVVRLAHPRSSVCLLACPPLLLVQLCSRSAALAHSPEAAAATPLHSHASVACESESGAFSLDWLVARWREFEDALLDFADRAWPRSRS